MSSSRGRIYKRLPCPLCPNDVAMPQFGPHMAREHQWDYPKINDHLKKIGKYDIDQVRHHEWDAHERGTP